MSNIRLQKILKKKTDEIATEFNCNASAAFIRLMLNGIFSVDEFEIDDAITDGGMDKGIDSIFEQENEDGENILYIVQSKYYQQNPDKSIDENSKNLIVEATSNYILGDYPLDNLNEKLKVKVENYRNRLSDGKIDRIDIVFITNGQKPGNNIISELDKFKGDNPEIFYEIYTEEDLSILFLPLSAMPVSEIELKVVKEVGGGDKTFLNMPDIDIVSGKVVRVDLCELAKIVKNNLNIFNANVRAYQSIRNKVNKQIAKTLSNPELLKQFIYLNNGITLLCDDFIIKPGNELMIIKKPSIINGCQTGSTILEAYEEGKLEENTGFILVRIIKSKDEQIKKSIILSSNTQTAVRNRDLVSEDEIQKQLEKQFLILGYYYERKKGMHRNELKEKIIDLEKAAQSYLALYLGKPAEAKNKKGEIYKSYYEQIFNKDITAEQLLISFILYSKISERIKEIRKKVNSERKSILGNSAMHLLPLYREWILKPSKKDLPVLEDDLSFIDIFDIKSIDNVIKKLESVIKNISKQKDFNPQYFFKSADSLSRILKLKEAKVEYEIIINKDNVKKYKDLRYYKPDKFSFDGKNYSKITHWNDLFVLLMNEYVDKYSTDEGNLDFIDSGSRILLIENLDNEERGNRKKIKNKLWLLTNFDSKRISSFCFAISKKLSYDLDIKLRPTRFRVQKKYKKRKKPSKS